MLSAVAPIRDDAGNQVATLTVSPLPGRGERPYLEDERIVVEEEGTYVFAVLAEDADAPIELAPSEELFSFDDATRCRGRLVPRQHVGRIKIVLSTGNTKATVTLSVRPKKLDEETEYRQMLDDIAEIATEAILQGFAPAVAALEPTAERRPELLYQQFAFLHARIMGRGERDLSMILNRPHTAWQERDELRLPGTPLRGGSRTLRALAKPGPRLPAPERFRLASVPERVASTHGVETFDTEPNRFVLFAIERWRALAQQVLVLLQVDLHRSGPLSRGIDAAEEIIELLDRTVAAPMFRGVGRLRAFPGGNQVLQKRAGYRELLRTFVLTETGARLALAWDVGDAFAASQRNVATLYEYWVFLQVARIIGEVCGTDHAVGALRLTNDGLSLGFIRGKTSRLRWKTGVRERGLIVELYFNREFLVSTQPDASWSRAMRPDCSVRVRPEGLAGSVSAEDLSVWIHFDAKYRVEFADGQFSKPNSSDGEAAAEAEGIERLARSKREDLLKMHAYRDAIRRSAGAYVLYPGDQHHEPFFEHHEVLPGLGAFVLRPGINGVKGSVQLAAFFEDVLSHVADRASQHERSRFWQTIIHRSAPAAKSGVRPLPALSSPPSDVPVLCGYVRSGEHLAWIERTGLYNVRAGNRRGAVDLDAEVLGAEDLLLYGSGQPARLWSRVGAWFVQSGEQLVRLGYPTPRGPVYLCCPIERRADEPEWLASVSVGSGHLVGEIPGAPFVLTWQQLLEAAG